VRVVAAEAHLDEHDLIAVLHNQVDLAKPATVIAF